MKHGSRIDDRAPAGKPGWIVSEPLAAVVGLCHGFSVRGAGDFAADAPGRRLLAETGARELRRLTQVHGVGRVAASDRRSAPEGDAWVGRPEPGVLLGILTADCLPVLLCHPASRTLGVAHAGWRGATAGIASLTLADMGVPPEEILVALGPSIGPCCFDVGPEVAEAAGARGARHLRPLAWGKHRFDLAGFVADELAGLGVRREAIQVVGLCTACHPELFYSHRRDGPTGRLCSFAGWVEP